MTESRNGKLKILFVVPYVPNLIRVRPYNLIRYLAGLGHHLTVMTLWSGSGELEDVRHLQKLGLEVDAVELPPLRSFWNSLQALPSRTPLQSVYCWQPALSQKLANRVAESRSNGTGGFDLVHVEHLRGARYGLALKQSAPGLPVVWDSVDSISMLFRQAAGRRRSLFGKALNWLELGRTERHEAWLARQFDHVLVTSVIDRDAFLSLDHSPEALPISVIPNGVDLDYFTVGETAGRSPVEIVVSGKMSYHANISMVLHLVNDIMPLVWARSPEAKVCVVGKDPPAEIQSLVKDTRVEVTGTVEDIRPHLQRAAVAAVPITYGAGIQNKVLEAMACGTPVVATPRAVSALSAVPGQDLLVADGAQAFANCLLSLLDNPQQRQEIGQSGRRYVERQHRWEGIAGRLEEVYREVISGQAEKSGQNSSEKINERFQKSW